MYIHSKKKKRKKDKTFPKGYQSGKEPLSETLFQLYWGNLCSFCVITTGNHSIWKHLKFDFWLSFSSWNKMEAQKFSCGLQIL